MSRHLEHLNNRPETVLLALSKVHYQNLKYPRASKDQVNCSNNENRFVDCDNLSNVNDLDQGCRFLQRCLMIGEIP